MKLLLLVEDDVDATELLRLHLKDEDVDVFVVANAIQGLQTAMTLPIDLFVIGDYRPLRNGPELVQRIRSAHPKANVISNSAMAFPDYIRDNLEAGANAFFPKPTDLFEMTKVIRVMLN